MGRAAQARSVLRGHPFCKLHLQQGQVTKLFEKLPNSRPEPAGLKRRIPGKQPAFLSAGNFILLLCCLIAHTHPVATPPDGAEKYLLSVGVATVATVWIAAFTTAIGCFVLAIMKGPASVADLCPLIDADHPRDEPATHPHGHEPDQ